MEKNWIKILKIGRDFEIFEIFIKLVRNWPIYKNSRNLANFEDIGFWVFANILFLIVELNCKIKIWDKLKTKENIFFSGGGVPSSKGRTRWTTHKFSNKIRPKSTPIHNSLMYERFEVNQISDLGAQRDYV
jgi:hypothetical protein